MQDYIGDLINILLKSGDLLSKFQTALLAYLLVANRVAQRGIANLQRTLEQIQAKLESHEALDEERHDAERRELDQLHRSGNPRSRST